MSLFFKHLLRSIRRRPLQPFLLVITLALAVICATFSFAADTMISEEVELSQAAIYGSADITVTLDGASESRFMFVREAEQILSDRARVAGTFGFPIASGEAANACFCVAADFSQIERIFSFSFLEYGVLTPSGIAEAAFISADFADARGLSVGDRFSAEVLGASYTYTVVGICRESFMDSYDVMVDITSVVRVLASDSLLLSSMKDGFRPCSTIYIDVLEGTAEDAIRMLNESSVFAQNTIADVASEVAEKNHTEALSSVLRIAIVLSVIFAIVVSYCCLCLLSHERTEENQSLKLCGVRASTLHALQYAEVFLYWLLGGALGIVLSIPLVRSFADFSRLQYAQARIFFADVIKSLLIVLLVAFLSVFVFTCSDRMRKPAQPKKRSAWLFYLPLALNLLLLGLSVLLPVRWRFEPFVFFMLFSAVSLFYYAAPLFVFAMRRIGGLLEHRSSARRMPLLYAVKNAHSVCALHNTMRLVSVLVLILSGLSVLMIGAWGHVRFAPTSFSAEYTVVGATPSCYRKVSGVEAVSDVYRYYMQSAMLENEETTLLLAADDAALFSESVRPKRMPEGNGAVISVAEANAHSLEVGDCVEIRVANQSHSLVIEEILNVGINCIIVDAESLGIHYNMLGVNGADGVSEAELLSQISAATATELAALVETRSLWEARTESVQMYLISGTVLLSSAVLFSLIGILNNLFQSYRARREEFVLYRIAGMSARQVRVMKLAEVVITLGAGVLLGALASVVFSSVMDIALRSRAYETFLNVRYFFRSL